MIENLVIVESPAKAKTIEKFLGKAYTVKSSFGHIRDLAKKNLGIDIQALVVQPVEHFLLQGTDLVQYIDHLAAGIRQTKDIVLGKETVG